MRTVLGLLLATFIGICPLVATAANEGEPRAEKTPPPQEPSALWVNIGGFSSHFNRDKGYNETNLGLGAEYRLTPEVSVMAGRYYNSIRQQTSYAAVNWQPWALGNWKLGAALGLMDGYPAIEKGGVFFAALPMATWEGRHVGVNLGLIPSMPKVDGAVILQIKFRL